MNRWPRWVPCVCLPAVLAACAARSPGDSTDVPAPRAPGVADATYDWHALLVAPFGTLVKETPVPLHEVLLFHDESHPAPEPETRECYAVDGTPPRFVGRQPENYVLCFEHDRLNRIEAAVRLTAGEAPRLFAAACARWLHGTVPAAVAGDACEGRDGDIAFSARLSLVPGETTAPLSITLSRAAPRETVREALGDTAHDP